MISRLNLMVYHESWVCLAPSAFVVRQARLPSRPAVQGGNKILPGFNKVSITIIQTQQTELVSAHLTQLVGCWVIEIRQNDHPGPV